MVNICLILFCRIFENTDLLIIPITSLFLRNPTDQDIASFINSKIRLGTSNLLV